MNELANYAVIVCKGSGCLYKTNSQDYDYVLTAKHVIEEEKELKVIHQYLDDEGHLINQELTIIGTPYLHIDPNKDAAILKIENLDNLGHLNRVEDLIVNNDTYNLIGHPDTRRNQAYSYRSNSLKLKNKKPNGYFEAELDKPSNHSEIVGQSGGGVIKYENGKYYIFGIQKKMSTDDEIELLSRIDLMPLSFFDEIVDQHPEDLENISLSFFESFSSLKDQVMMLNGVSVETHIKFTRNYLRSITDKVVANRLSPSFIKDFFKERLLIHNQHHKSLNHKKLWLAWLEFLIIMNICKANLVDDTNIEDIFNSHRLIFSMTNNDWTLEFENIIKSDFKGLKNDSKIIVSTNSVPVMAVIPANHVPDIIREQAIPMSELMIDEASSYPLVGRKLIHLTAFQRECIIAKSIEYKDYTTLNENELIIKLKTEYERLFE